MGSHRVEHACSDLAAAAAAESKMSGANYRRGRTRQVVKGHREQIREFGFQRCCSMKVESTDPGVKLLSPGSDPY